MYLYFGCRRSTMDYIYQEELENAVKDGVLSKVYTSFSRDPDQPKVRH